jgi:hypothetical protein
MSVPGARTKRSDLVQVHSIAPLLQEVLTPSAIGLGAFPAASTLDGRRAK